MTEQLHNILGILPALKRELEAFAETRTKHDRQRAINAVEFLQKATAELKAEIMNVQLRREEDE